MAKERLSKLQKWILEKCIKEVGVSYQDVAEFFGKKYTNRKPELIGEGHDLRKRYGENYRKELDIEKVQQEQWGGYIWHGLKISRKPELCFTNSEKAVASRSLKGLVKKGFLIQQGKWGSYRLTETGFLKANKNGAGDKTISFKEYQEMINKKEQERKENIKEIAEFFKAIKG